MGKSFPRFFGDLHILVAITVSFSVLAGCVKKRPDVDAQGAYLDQLTAVKDISNWHHTIVTTADKPEFSLVTESNTVKVEPDVTNINVQGVVKFHSDDPLLQGQENSIQLIGKPSTAYPLAYKLTSKYLKIFKRVPAKEISSFEIPVSDRDGGDYLVPIGGYPVSYYNVSRIKNEDNRDTNIKNRWNVTADRYKTAPYVQIDRAGFIPFNRVQKKDYYPASYFTEGKWYFAKTVISTKPGDDDALGVLEDAMSVHFDFANKIAFRRHKGYLRGVNVSVADLKKKYEKKKGDAEDDVIAIPVDWEDFRVKPEGDGTGLTEEKYEYRDDVNRDAGEFHFSNMGIIAGQGLQDFLAKMVISSIRLEDLHFSKNGFSFTLNNIGRGERTKYSFRRVMPSDYVPRTYKIEDEKIFGTFKTVSPYVFTSKDERRSDVESINLMNRFNPKKPIVFHFSKDTPKLADLQNDPTRLKVDYRAIGRYCTSYWNRVFELAGTNIKVTLDESSDADLGDINYNQINIIDTLNEDGMLGVAPSTVDPETGEIVSGVANIYIAGHRKELTGELRNYIRVRSGLARDTVFPSAIQKQYPRVMDFVQKEVEYFCPDLVAFADSLKPNALNGKGQDSSLVENEHIDRCMEKILPRMLTSVTCHEMGHVFNLRHNFRGSMDDHNSLTSLNELKKLYPPDRFPEIYKLIYPDGHPEFLPESTSIMDYEPFDRPYLALPGRYDIATIAYGYSGKVELKGTRAASANGVGRWASYDMTRDLKIQPVYANSEKFQYCTDEDAYPDATNKDVMCQRFDFGNTPQKLMEFYFLSIRDAIVVNFNRLDRDHIDYWPVARSEIYVHQMERIYSRWRDYLYDFVGRNNASLAEYVYGDPKYDELRANLKQNFPHKEFLGISEQYFHYMSTLMSIPDLECVAIRDGADPRSIDANKDIKLLNFAKLQNDIVTSHQTSKVTGCTDPATNVYLAGQYGGKWKIIGQIGQSTAYVKSSQSFQDRHDNFDTASDLLLRQEAANGLFQPMGNLFDFEAGIRNFNPSAFDEPYIHENATKFFLNRFIVGQDLKAPITDFLTNHGYALNTSTPIKPFKLFDNDLSAYEGPLQNAFKMYHQNDEMLSPQVKAAARQNATVYTSLKLNDIHPGEIYYHDPMTARYYFSSSDHEIAYSVISKLREMEEPGRFNIRSIDISAQEGLYQLSELIKDLPANNADSTRLTLQTVQHMVSAIDGFVANADPSLKTQEMSDFTARIQAIGTALRTLDDIKNSSSNNPIKISEKSDMTANASVAGNLLQKISVDPNELKRFLMTIGLTSRDLTQKGVLEMWIRSHGNSQLINYWQTTMSSEIDERIRFRQEESDQYAYQHAGLWKILVQGLVQEERSAIF